MRSFLRVYIPIIAISLVWIQPRSASGAVIASDDFSSYSPGSDNLLGQPAGGIGFTGTWHCVRADRTLTAGLDVFPDGSVGSVGVLWESNAGSALDFASPISIGGRQLFIRYTHTNLDPSDPQASTRLDINETNETLGNRVLLGAYGSDSLKIALEDNLHTGSGELTADSGIGTVSGDARHTVVGLLDAQFGQIAIWVDPEDNDYYDCQTGSNSADAATAWGVPPGGIAHFISYGLIRNRLDDVEFDDVVFATSASDVGLGRVTHSSTTVSRLTWAQTKAEQALGRQNR